MNDTTTMRIISAAITDRGLSQKRPVNEDSYLELIDRGLFSVADGVGGAQAGDVASQMAMEVLFEAFSHPQNGVDTEELMEMAIQRANQSIFHTARELPQLDMMATTIVALHIENNIATIGHVGDSRLYRLDARGNLFRETQDHSVVEEEVRAGRMTAEQAANHPSRNVISRALGAEETVEVDMKTIMIEPGTSFLLCSDGVTRHIEDGEIREILLENEFPNDACSEIKNLCYGRGAEDNLTAVIVKIPASEESSLQTDDELTIAAPRLAPDDHSFATAANGSGSAIYKSEANTAELPAIPDVSKNGNLDTTPLELPKTIDNSTNENRDVDATDGQKSPAGITLQSKLVNERLREKVKTAEPLPVNEAIQPPRSVGAVKNFLKGLLVFLLGSAVSSGLLLAYFRAVGQQPPTQPAINTPAPPIVPPPIQNSPLVSDLTEAEINEFRTFERARRAVDGNPAASINSAAPNSAADFYLRGRAFLETGDLESALRELKTAQSKLSDSRDVNADTLRADVAIALAAVAALANNPGEERTLNDLINEKKTNLPPPVANP